MFNLQIFELFFLEYKTDITSTARILEIWKYF